MKANISEKAVSFEHRQTFLINHPFSQLGWLASQKLQKNKNISTWNMVTVIMVAFLIITTASFGVNFLIHELEWQASQTNSWWGEGFNSAGIPNRQFNESGNTKIFPNYLTKPIVYKNIINNLADYWQNNFGIGTALAAELNVDWQADLVSLSAREINIRPGGAITIEARYINNGSKIWRNQGADFVSLNVTKPNYHDSELYHIFWPTKYQPARLLETEVKVGEVGTFRFALQAPATDGRYQENFIIAAENESWLNDSIITIALNVGEFNKPVIPQYSETNLAAKIINGEIERDIDFSNISPSSTTTAVLAATSLRTNEPLIRVGLYKTVDPIIITANQPFAIVDQEGKNIKILNESEKVAITYDVYSKGFLVSASGFFKAFPSVTVAPLSTTTIFTITNYENRPKWNLDWNDNRYRGKLEVRYGARSGQPWVINELPMEDYIRGIKETSEVSPMEYQKAIAIAARSYAYWQLQANTKHKENNFTVDAVWDQVYRGYNAEVQIPKFSEAVTITEGVMVTYKDEVALTPYFAQSDGRTRSFQEVWQGVSKPWLVSVADPTNDGLRKWGHGVGMSARGALLMASRQNKTAAEILKYYYTGVTVEQIYQRNVTVEIATLLPINEDEPRI